MNKKSSLYTSDCRLFFLLNVALITRINLDYHTVISIWFNLSKLQFWDHLNCSAHIYECFDSCTLKCQCMIFSLQSIFTVQLTFFLIIPCVLSFDNFLSPFCYVSLFIPKPFINPFVICFVKLQTSLIGEF